MVCLRGKALPKGLLGIVRVCLLSKDIEGKHFERQYSEMSDVFEVFECS